MTTDTSVAAEPTATSYPVLSVVDTAGESTVIWHVLTGPDTVTGRFNGGWVLDDDPAVESVVRGTWIVPADGTPLTDRPWIDSARGVLTVAEVQEAIAAGVEDLQRIVEDYVADHPGTKRVRFVIPAAADPAEFAAAFHGDDQARQCWVTAQVVADLVRGWLEVETTRRKRRWLQEACGKFTRALPLPGL